MESQHVVAVIGGAVAGSEAVFQLREKGIRVICIEQNALPYGKIEDGLPRWHVEQRLKEEEKINERLDHALVDFIPNTKLGATLSFDEIYNDWKLSAILLANGAWRDRPLGLEKADDFIGKGLLYQNPLVYWFNHKEEKNYQGPSYEIPDQTIVIGGGLASMDVMKICQIELIQNELKKRGFQADMLSIEKEGVPKTLHRFNLKWEELKLKGTTLFYRRRPENMPLAPPPENATPEQMEKIGQLRAKILSNFQTKYLFSVEPQHVPHQLIAEKGKLVGLTFRKKESEKDVRGNLVISSIGSIPEPLPGIPMKGETYAVTNLENGAMEGLKNVYALGNAVTGRGNIRVSLTHGRQVAQNVRNELLKNSSLKVTPAQIEKINLRVRELQNRVGYAGNYREWIASAIAKRG